MADDMWDLACTCNEVLDELGIQCNACDAIDEITRLRAQVEHAHAILASEGAAWLVVGSSHEQSWRQSLTPAIQSYWDKYGNYFKEADRG